MTDIDLLTVTEVAALLRLSKSQTYAMVQRGEIPSIRIGRSVRVRRERLEEWLREQEGRRP